MMNFNINSALLSILIVFAALNFHEQYQMSREVRRMIEWQKSTFRQPERLAQENVTSVADGGYIKKPAPPYPAAAREREEEGSVTIEVMISELGEVESTRVVKSSGSPRLDRAAKEAAARSSYKPKSQNGIPMRTRFIAGYTFQLDE